MITAFGSRPEESSPHKFDSQDDKRPPTFYIDMLPTEVVDNVFRFFSRLPVAEQWENHIPLKDVVELYRFGGAFIRLFVNRFRTLCISRTIDCWDENKIFKWKLRRERMLWTNNINVAHDFVLAGGGESLRTLIVGRDMYYEYRDGTALVDSFHARCPNLASLSIQEKGCVWTSRFGEQVKTIEIWTSSSRSISHYCTNLRELTVMFSQKLLPGTKLWENIGPSLETLTIAYNEMLSREIGKIELHCRNIRRISIGDVSRDGKTSLSKLLASYGDQLQLAEIPCLNEVQWNSVMSVCTKARFHVAALGLSVLDPYSLLPSLNIVGLQLEKVRVGGRIFAGNITEFSHAWSKCDNLRELHIQVPNTEHIRAVFSTPKPQLKKMHLDFSFFDDFMDDNEMIQVMKIISSGTKAVEAFSLTCSSYRDFSWDCLGSFFELKKSSLSYVSLPFRYGDEEIADILEILLGASVLKEIHCTGERHHTRAELLVKAGVQCRGITGPIHYEEPATFDWNLLV